MFFFLKTHVFLWEDQASSITGFYFALRGTKWEKYINFLTYTQIIKYKNKDIYTQLKIIS